MSQRRNFQQPQYQGYRKQGGGSGAKTLLIVLGVFGVTVFLGCGGVIAVIGYGYFAAKEAVVQRDLNIQKKIEEEQAAKVAPPATFDDAIIDLNKSDRDRRIAVLEWLRKTPPTSIARRRVANAIAGCLKGGNNEESALAMDALSSWSEKSIAPMIADSLKRKDEQTLQKLELLKQFRDPTTFVAIASLLGDSRWGGQAKATLKDIGSMAGSAIASQLESRDSQARTYAQQLLEELGIDADSAKISVLLDNIKKDSGKRKALDSLAGAIVQEEYRAQVNAALMSELKASTTYQKEALNALNTWADNSIVRDLNRFASNGSLSSTNKGKVYDLMAKLGDESSIPVLVKALGDYGASSAISALENYGDKAVNETLKYYNSEDSTLQKNVRKLIASIGADNTAIIKQCSEDLIGKPMEVQLLATDYLRTCELVDSLQPQVSQRLANLYNDDDLSVFKKPKVAEAYIHWVSKEKQTTLVVMLEDREDAVWKSALNKLLEFKDWERIKVPVAVLMSDFFKGKETRAILMQKTAEIEPFMIMMLESEDIKVVKIACEVISNVGTEKSRQPLKDLLAKAGKFKNAEAATYARLATEAINTRRGTDKK